MKFLQIPYSRHRSARQRLNVHSNNNISVHGAVNMTTAIARVHPVHLVTADSVPGGRQLALPSANRPRFAVTILESAAPIPYPEFIMKLPQILV